MQSHHVPAPVPVVEAAGDADAFRIRRPDRKACALDAVDRPDACAQFFVDLLVGAFTEQVKIHVPECLAEAVVVLDRVAVPTRVRDLQQVVAFPWRHDADEQTARVHSLRLRKQFAVRVDEIDAAGMRLQRAHDAPVAGTMNAEQRERIRMPPLDERLKFVLMALKVCCYCAHKASLCIGGPSWSSQNGGRPRAFSGLPSCSGGRGACRWRARRWRRN